MISFIIDVSAFPKKKIDVSAGVLRERKRKQTKKKKIDGLG
jgi:hypothetical protein